MLISHPDRSDVILDVTGVAWLTIYQAQGYEPVDALAPPAQSDVTAPQDSKQEVRSKAAPKKASTSRAGTRQRSAKP